MRKFKHVIVERLEFIDVRDLKKAGALEGHGASSPAFLCATPSSTD